MNPFQSNDAPMYVKREFEQLQSLLAPSIKKTMLYAMIAMPLISFSLFNLYFFIASSAINRNTAVIVGVFALAGALGLALLKESMHKKKELQQKSLEYMKGRIKNSDNLADSAKNKYLEDIQKKPTKSYQIFYEFLQHEERMRQLNNN